jgi:ribonuclease VapC
MTVFIDTSAIVEILLGGGKAEASSRVLEVARIRHTAPHVRLETCMVLSTRLNIKPEAAQDLFDAFLDIADVSMLSLQDAFARTAVEAFAVYGKGRGHPAQLNFGDCLSYGCARGCGATLLFIGDDFSQTDIVGALAAAKP